MILEKALRVPRQKLPLNVPTVDQLRVEHQVSIGLTRTKRLRFLSYQNVRWDDLT